MITKKDYKFKLKLLVILIFALITIGSMTSKISQDYTNYNNLYFNNDNLIPLDNKYDNYLMNLYYSTNWQYLIGMIFLASIIFILGIETLSLYRELKGSKIIN